MEEELQELRALVAQLRTDNEQLRQETPAVIPAPNASASNPSIAAATPAGSSSLPDTGPLERFVFIPRDHKCPKFNGRTGIDVNEWVEEARACMRARHMSTVDQAFFLIDHLEGEAREELRYRSGVERRDPDQIIAALRELYGCTRSYVVLQELFFSRRQQEGETLVEFSLALMSLWEKVKEQAPHEMLNTGALLRDQFVENVSDNTLRRELKQLVRRSPNSTLLEVRSEAIRWEREGTPGGSRGRSHSVPTAHCIQYGVQGQAQPGGNTSGGSSELRELKEMMKMQQQQLNQLTQSLAHIQRTQMGGGVQRFSHIICRRCKQPGHYARECEGEHRATRFQSTTPAGSPWRGGPAPSGQPSEN